jgi:hypothetical protein
MWGEINYVAVKLPRLRALPKSLATAAQKAAANSKAACSFQS